MLDLAFNESVVLRKPNARTPSNEVTYSVVRESDGKTEARLKCLIDRRIHRLDTRETKEITGDATVVYRADKFPGDSILLGWIVIDSRGVCYEVGDISEALNFGAWYRRAELKKVRNVVPVEGN